MKTMYAQMNPYPRGGTAKAKGRVHRVLEG